AQTQGSGIKLVDVLGGDGASALNAFRLGGPVAAGAFTYNLFRGGPQNPDGDWYLRTQAVVPPDPPVGPPTNPPTPPVPPVTPIPTYRPEAALFAALPGFLRNIDAAVPGSRAARIGDEAGGLAVARRGRAWARYIRQDIDTTQQGTVAPSVTGDTTGYQFGVELFGGKDEDAAQIGLYGGRLEGNAAVRGSSNGVANTLVGTLDPTITYAGVYVARSRGRGLYFDAVLQYGWYGGEASTLADGEVAKIKGTGGYASLETGYGFAIVPSLVIEPQLQIVAQPQRVHDLTIVNAQVVQDPANTLMGRAGLRVKGDFGQPSWRLQPYVAVSIWQGLDHRDRTRFSGNGVTQTTLETYSELKATELAGGLSLGVGSRFVGFAEYSRLSSRGDPGMARDGNALSAGLRFAW
ncbi:MAG: autotransporter outer membrane beta-barrel domain-containing protein, partial [Steroidobacteraceae bacterium]